MSSAQHSNQAKTNTNCRDLGSKSQGTNEHPKYELLPSEIGVVVPLVNGSEMIEKGMQPAVRYEVHTLLVSQTLQVWFLAVVFFFLRGFSMRVLEFFFLCPLTKHRFVFDGSMSSTQRNPEIVANVRFSRVLPTASLGDFEAKPDLQVFFSCWFFIFFLPRARGCGTTNLSDCMRPQGGSSSFSLRFHLLFPICSPLCLFPRSGWHKDGWVF